MLRRILLACGVMLAVAAISPSRGDPVFQSSTVACTRSALYDASTNGSTRLVIGNSSQQVYVCGYAILSGGTANVKLVYGTGGTCGTGTQSVTPTWNLIAQAGIVDHQTFYAGLPPVPVSNDLCLNSSAGVAVQAIVYYAQF